MIYKSVTICLSAGLLISSIYNFVVNEFDGTPFYFLIALIAWVIANKKKKE